MRRAGGRRISSVAGCHLMDAERTVSLGWLCLQSYSPLTLGSVIQESLGKTLNSKLLRMTPGGTDHSAFSSLFIFVSQTDDTAGFQKFPMTEKRVWPNKKKTAELCNSAVCLKESSGTEKNSLTCHTGETVSLLLMGWLREAERITADPTKTYPDSEILTEMGGKWKRKRLYC